MKIHVGRELAFYRPRPAARPWALVGPRGDLGGHCDELKDISYPGLSELTSTF